MRSLPTYTIDFERMPTREAGMLLLVLLAYPGEQEQDERLIQFQRLAATTGELPAHLRRRLSQRLVMAVAALPFVTRLAPGEDDVPRGLSRLALGRAIKHAAQRADDGPIGRRQWVPSLPVLHLAVALAALLEGARPRWNDLLHDREALAAWIVAAERQEALVIRAFPGEITAQLRVRLAPAKA